MAERHTPLYIRLRRTLDRAVQPHPAVTDARMQYRARLTSTLLLIQIILTIATILIGFIVDHELILDNLLLFVIGPGWIVFLYSLSRTRYIQEAILLYIPGILILVTITYLQLQQTVQPGPILNFMVLAPFLASLLLSIQTTAWIALLTIAVIVALALTDNTRSQFYGPIIFNALANSLIIASAMLRSRDLRRLRESEERHRSLMNASVEIIIFYDRKGHILDASNSMQIILGYDPHEIIGRVAIEFVARRSRHEAMRHWRSGSKDPIEIYIRHKTGHLIPVEMRIMPQTYRDRFVYAIVAKDIRHRKEAERRRIEYERRYQALLNNTTDAVFIMDMDGTYLTANEQAAHMLNCTLPDIIGQSFESFIIPDEQEQVMNNLRRVMTGQAVPVYMRHFRRSDGTTFPADVTIMLVRDADDNPLYIQSLVRDITTRQQTEQQKFELAVQQERMDILQNFINNASHHFRTPLAIMKTTSYLIKRLNDPAKRLDKLHNLDMQINIIEALVEDLLTITRLESESQSAQKDPLAVNRLIHLLIEQIRSRDNHEKHRWQVTYCPHNLTVQGDSRLLQTALMAIIDNSIAYTEDNGTITLSTAEKHNYAIITIADTGIGIDKSDLPHIFKDFFRATNAIQHTTRSIHSGMGLFISKKIIDFHNGIITVESQLDEGTTMTVMLPLVSQPFGTDSHTHPDMTER